MTGSLSPRARQTDIPPKFAALTKILASHPIVRQDGSAGLLDDYRFGNTIDVGALPDLTEALDHLVAENEEPDLAAITAALRGYTFIASAYLLELSERKGARTRKAATDLVDEPCRDVLLEHWSNRQLCKQLSLIV